ncbi:hypothetical protein STCU_07761 [Strigomonas culicis]|nr:hypothetical protein STCU_07761 [Strigomonas culicis]|eukprot:EPY23328.1 hypothetical protein STCU_07761 [Strigomonas culicis]
MCQDPIDRTARDWNEEFQFLSANFIHYHTFEKNSSEKMARFTLEFETYAKKLVENYMSAFKPQADAAPGGVAAGPRPSRDRKEGCVRIGNMVLRVWRDAKLGLNFQRCIRAFALCRPGRLYYPLIATFRVFHVSVSVMAIVPLARDRPPVYRGDGGCDPVLHVPLRQQLGCMLDCLNSKRSLYTDENLPGIEIHEGLDGRLYLLNPLGILPPFMSSTGPAVPLRRISHLLKQPEPEPYFPPPMSAYAKDVATIHFQLAQVLNEQTMEARLEELVSALHVSGLNVCLLPMVAAALLATPKEDQEEYTRTLVILTGVEIIARTVRHVMFQEARLHYGSRIPLHQVNVYVARAVGTFVSGASPAAFVDGLLPYMEERFVFDKASREELREALTAVVDSSAEAITMRLTRLCGLQMMRGTVGQVLVCPSHQNLHSFFQSNFSNVASYLTHWCANSSTKVKNNFVRPIKVQSHILNDRVDLAWVEMRQLLLDRAGRSNAPFVESFLWMVGALIAALAGDTSAAMTLIDKARLVVETVPAYMVGAGEHHTVIPRYPYYVMGQVTVLTCSVYVFCIAKKYSEAEQSGTAALRALDKLNSGNYEDLTSLREEVMLAFMEVAAHAESVEKLISIDKLWLKEGRGGAFSPRAARISEILGSLFLENNMYSHAVERFSDCLTITENLLGERSAAAGESLNKLAFAYYRWNVHTYGTVCSCLLHRAEDIMVDAYGRYSPMHLSVVENIITVFIERGWFVAASSRLHAIQNLPARYAVHIPKDHPTLLRARELKARICEDADFQEVAVSIIEFAWIEYRSKHLLKGVWERSVKEVQRVGRAFLARQALQKFAQGALEGDVQNIERLQHLHHILLSSKPLLAACRMYCTWDHNWNGEYQLVRLFGPWWNETEGTETLNTLGDVRARFCKKAEDVVRDVEAGALAPKPVPDCSTSFVVDNIVFTRIPKHSRLDQVQSDLFDFISQELFIPMTAPLSTIVRSSACDFFAEALLPLRHQPEMIFTSDGRAALQNPGATHEVIMGCVNQYRLQPFEAQHIQGVEIVRGADLVGYITNALGIVIDSTDPDPRPLAQPLSQPLAALSHTIVYQCILLCLRDKADKANDLLEQKILSLDAANYNEKPLYTAFLSYTRFIARPEDFSNYQHVFDQIEELGDAGLALVVILIHYMYARTLYRKDFLKDAMQHLLCCFRTIRRTRLHACFAAYIVLECASFLQVVAFACDRRIDDWVLKVVREAITHGEPTMLLFTTCERFVMYHKHFEEAELAEAFVQLRVSRAKEVPPYVLDRITEELSKASEDGSARDANERQKRSALCLSTALHLSKIHRENTKEFAVLLTRYGALLMAMGDLPAAKKTLHQAYAILSAAAPDGPEMIVWRNYSRLLKRRLRERAMDVIRRAVRGWRERRQAEAEMRVAKPEAYKTLQLIRLTRRRNRLTVAESTSRVLIADAQTEDWYQLLRRQHRMRNDAMLRRTYGARLRVYLDKLVSMGEDLLHLAETSKRVMAHLFLELRHAMEADFFVKTHRLSRRGILAEWRDERVKLRLWHVENIESVIRHQYVCSHNKFIAKCIDAEQNLWRGIIVARQKQVKLHLGRYFSKKRAKPKKPHLEGKAIELDEERQRDKLLDTEEEAFRLIVEGFTFGPEVYSEEEYDP